MKKILFFAAVTALAFTACTSDDNFEQNAQKAEVEQRGVGFDVYVPGSLASRAGYTGTMTTSRLQEATAGFGVYAFYSDQQNKDQYTDGDGYPELNSSYIPNFMVNEKVLWNNTNQGWEYAPLKYWPNETVNDSQSDPAYMERNKTNHQRLDRLTFFAYAPYVSAGVDEPGITTISTKEGTLTPKFGNADPITSDPSVEYLAAFTSNDLDNAATDPNEGVDLLWGVAPSGNLSYTAVNGETTTVGEGLPLINMTKPSVSTNMKFLFEHALARFGVKVAAAIDQVAQGGTLDDSTKITIDTVKVTGYFGRTGILNLNNGKTNASAGQAVGAHMANWMRINGVDLASDLAAATFLVPANKQTIVITGSNIAPNLKYQGTYASPKRQDVVGVTTSLQDLIAPSTTFFTKQAKTPAYDPAKLYYTAANTSSPATATYKTKAGEFYTFDGSKYTVVAVNTPIPAPTYPKFDASAGSDYYTVALSGTYAGNTTNDLAAETQFYTRTGEGTTENPWIYANKGNKATIEWGSDANTYYTLTGTRVQTKNINFVYDPAGTYYAAERNFFMVVPTYNVTNNLASPWDSDDVTALNTITVEITYYITTEDDKLKAKRSQSRNTITKDIVLPHINNGQSYSINLLLGLTSVKVEAEVADWKVTNVQGDLPQNTAE